MNTTPKHLLTHRRVRSFGAPVLSNVDLPELLNKDSRQQPDSARLRPQEDDQGSLECDSSTGAGETESEFADDTVGEKHRIIIKLEKNRELLKRIAAEQEANVDEFIKMTKSVEMSGASPENPQMQRIRAHFEKKNKRFAQYSEQIQKKLAVLSHRLHEAEIANHQKPLINDIGKNSELKKTELGRGPEEEGTAKFYVRLYDDSNVLNSSNVSGASGDRCRSHSDENTSNARLPDVSPKQSSAPNNVSLMRARSKYDAEELKKEVAELRLRHFASVEAVETVQAVVKNELQYFNNSFHEERVKHQHLEELLNDTIELNQAEIVGLKNELQSLTKRMEYHYNDKMTELRETIEALQNRVEKAETTLDEHFSRSHSRLGTGQALALSSANILVEVLKIVLFVSSVALDALKPLTGTRARAGVCVVIWTSIMVLLHWSGHLTSFFRHNATEAATLQN